MAEDRLDRIEGALDALRLRQEASQTQLDSLGLRQEASQTRLEAFQETTQNYIDSQIPVIAELRASNIQIREMTAQFRESLESILQIVMIHQQNFEVVVNELREMRSDIRRLQTGES